MPGSRGFPFTPSRPLLLEFFLEDDLLDLLGMSKLRGSFCAPRFSRTENPKPFSRARSRASHEAQVRGAQSFRVLHQDKPAPALVATIP